MKDCRGHVDWKSWRGWRTLADAAVACADVGAVGGGIEVRHFGADASG